MKPNNASKLLTLNVVKITFLLLIVFSAASAQSLKRLKVSDNKRFLVKEDGSTFFYLADNSWELFHRLNREEVKRYLQTRADQGFSVIHTAALAELDGLKTPNAMGDLPLVNNDPLQPAVTPGSNPNDPAQYDYWDHIDFVIREAAQRGIYVAIAPSWGTWVHDYSYFNNVNCKVFGEFLGQRYGDKPVVWILGGDRNPVEEKHKMIWQLIAEGIKTGSGKTHDELMMTYHPMATYSSSQWFHNEPWLDFNMIKTGHCKEVEVYKKINEDLKKTPAKPVLDGESLYEDLAICFKAKEKGYSTDSNVRKNAYWSIFSGALGFTYGNHSVWQMYSEKNPGIFDPDNYWYEALKSPAADQMKHLRNLIESRPLTNRIPDHTVLNNNLNDQVAHLQALRSPDGSFLFVYSAAGFPVNLKLAKISGKKVRSWWYNPRTGEAKEIGEFANPGTGTKIFTPATQEDWVLVLDDVNKNFPPPGQPTAVISRVE